MSAGIELLDDIKSLATRYYMATGKPLGVTGEVSELEAAEKLGLELAEARTAGYDATWVVDGQPRRVQIKGRAVDAANRYVGRCPAIKCGNQFDDVLLVLLDRQTMNVLEIWRAEEVQISARLSEPGSRSRNERNSMGISQFVSTKTGSKRVWP
jgi:hypothetical protein